MQRMMIAVPATMPPIAPPDNVFFPAVAADCDGAWTATTAAELLPTAQNVLVVGLELELEIAVFEMLGLADVSIMRDMEEVIEGAVVVS